MANKILTTDLVANYTLAEWSAYPLFLHTANRDLEMEWIGKDYKYGDSVQVRRRNRAIIQDGPTGVVDIRAITEESEILTINHWYKDAFTFTNRDLTLDVDKFYERYVRPTVMTMAAEQDNGIGQSAEEQVSYFVGTPGTPLNSYQALSDITAKFQEIGLEKDMERYLAVTPNDAATMRATFANFFNGYLNKNIIQDAKLGRIDRLDIIESTGLKRHIAGTPGAGPITVSTTVGAGTAINMTGFTPLTLVVRKGDVFSIAGVKNINPLRQKETSFDAQFIATADATSDVTGNATILVQTAGADIISDPTNANKNVSNAIQAGSVVTFVGDHNVNIAYIPRALSLVSPPLEPLRVPDSSVVTDSEMMASLRMSVDGDVRNGVNLYRLEMISGNKWHPQYCIRVLS